MELVFATDRCDVLDDPWRDAGDSDPLSRRGRRRSTRFVDGGRTPPIDGVLAVGDRPTVIAARVAQALGLPWHPPEAAAIARDKQRTRERLAGTPVCRCPGFVASRLDADPRDLVRPHRVSVCRQAGRAVGQPRRDARRRSAEAFARRSTGCARCCARRISAPSGTTRTTASLVEGFIPGREFALEGLLDHGALARAGDLRQARSARRPVLRRDDLRHALRSASAGQQARSSTPSRARPRRSGCGTARSTPNAASTTTACSCSKSPRGRSAGCARGRCGFSERQSRRSRELRPLSRSRSCCCGTRSANRPTAGGAKPRASGVMMIPIPRRGVFRGVVGRRRGAGGCRHRRRRDHRQARSAAGAAAGRRQLSRVHLRARRRPPLPWTALAPGARAAGFEIEPELRMLANVQMRYNQRMADAAAPPASAATRRQQERPQGLLREVSEGAARPRRIRRGPASWASGSTRTSRSRPGSSGKSG